MGHLNEASLIFSKSTEWNFKQKKAAHACPQALQRPPLNDLRRPLFGVKSEDLG